jgi:hypothetical protein
MRCTGHVPSVRQRSGTYRMLVRKLEGKRPLGGPKRRWDDNIKTDLQEVGWEAVDWVDLAQGRNRWQAF